MDKSPKDHIADAEAAVARSLAGKAAAAFVEEVSGRAGAAEPDPSKKPDTFGPADAAELEAKLPDLTGTRCGFQWDTKDRQTLETRHTCNVTGPHKWHLCSECELAELSRPTDAEGFTQSFDARDWAAAFVKTARAHPGLATDEGTMLGWFANALMRGYDEGRSSLQRVGLNHPEPTLTARLELTTRLNALSLADYGDSEVEKLKSLVRQALAESYDEGYLDAGGSPDAEKRLSAITTQIRDGAMFGLPDLATPEEAVAFLLTAWSTQKRSIGQYQEMLKDLGYDANGQREVEGAAPTPSPEAGKGPSEPDRPQGRLSVLVEAEGLVHGDRNASYGHPLDAYLPVAEMIRAYLKGKHGKLVDVTPEDVAVFFVLAKLGRQAQRPKRDNWVDIAGYAEVAQWILDESKTRGFE